MTIINICLKLLGLQIGISRGHESAVSMPVRMPELGSQLC
jgi:hypothetical protein